MSSFEFPTNIRQIGSIGDGLRIYIEDYAYTYLKQYSEAGGYDERIALLIGRHMIIDGNRVLFISGAIQGMHAHKEHGILTFSEEAMNYAYEKMQIYFRGLEIVGWMQSQPSYGVAPGSSSITYHASTFLKPDQVLFAMDPVEDLSAFYTWSTDKEDLEEAQGYFIYYDKNRGMQEYMLENRAREKEKPTQSTFRLLSKPVEHTEPEELPSPPKAAAPSWRQKQALAEEAERPAVPVSFIKPRMTGDATPVQERRLTNLLVSLSAVLVLICFIMGAGLIQNEGRITILEDQLVLLTMSFRDMVTNSDSRAESAFAPSQSMEAPVMITQDVPMYTEDFTPQEMLIPQQNLSAQEHAMPQELPMPVLVSPTPTPESSAHATTPMPEQEPMPVAEAQPVSVLIPEVYTIEQGDSLLYISRKFYGTTEMVSRIIELNGIDNPNMLQVGKTIWLPRLEQVN